MPELLNSNELAVAVASAPVTDGHTALLDALNARYPSAGFRLVGEREGRTWQPGIIDREGARVADSLVVWIDQELAAAGGDAREVWRRHKDSGLVRTEWSGSVIYLASPYGSDPDAFFQLEVMVGKEVTTRQMFDPNPWELPVDRFDLISGGVRFGDEDQRILSPPRYQLDALTNVRRFLRELVEVEKADRLSKLPKMEQKVIHVSRTTIGPQSGPGTWEFSQESEDVRFLDMFPDWLERRPAGLRFFQDWQESSPGKSGLRLCDHWFITTNDWHDKDGKRQLSLTPQWADADGGLDLPEIHSDWDASPYGVMESLSEFDKSAGYPFAWYFYMLHGNRIGHSSGSVVARAIMAGKMKPLPAWDETVLLRWEADRYGF
ncbi:hypothetical protein A2G06_16795 (plasmid) [Geobacter anodireducens]|nr:hypothetical protein A2G06_16795 [Geobacter anodireducens]